MSDNFELYEIAELAGFGEVARTTASTGGPSFDAAHGIEITTPDETLVVLLEKEDNETVIRTFTPSGVNLGTIRFGGYLADSSYVASALAGILNAAVGA